MVQFAYDMVMPVMIRGESDAGLGLKPIDFVTDEAEIKTKLAQNDDGIYQVKL
jgi:hypothetical protein